MNTNVMVMDNASGKTVCHVLEQVHRLAGRMYSTYHQAFIKALSGFPAYQ